MATNVCLNPVNFCAEGLEEAPPRVSVNTIFDFRTEDYRDVFAFQPFPRPLSEYTDSLGRTARVFAPDAGLSLTSFTNRSRTPSLVRQEFAGRHDFQITEAAMGGEIFVLFALASLFGKRIPEQGRLYAEVPDALRGVYQHCERLSAGFQGSEMASRLLEEINSGLERSGTNPQRWFASIPPERRALYRQVLRLMQTLLQDPQSDLASFQGLRLYFDHLVWDETALGSRAIGVSSSLNTRFDLEFSELSQRWQNAQGAVLAAERKIATDQRRIEDIERELASERPGVGSSVADLRAERDAKNSRRGALERELERLRAEFNEIDLLHQSFQLIQNLRALDEGAFVAAFGE